MVAPKSFAFSFSNVFAYKSDRALLLGSRDYEIDSGEDTGCFFAWVDGAWTTDDLPFAAADVIVATSPKPTVVCMATDGRIVTRSGVTFERELVDATEDGPHRFGGLRELRSIGGVPYAVGMARTAYRRDEANRWTRIDRGLRSDDATDDSGLNSIDGSPDGMELLAVGWGGELWRRTSDVWTQLASPTTRTLFKIVRLRDGSYLAAGQTGTLVHISGSVAREVQHNATKADFYGLNVFRDQVYLATTEGLFLWSSGRCEPLAIKSKKKIRFDDGDSFGDLHSTDDMIWSVGPKLAMFSTDGATWRETPYR